MAVCEEVEGGEEEVEVRGGGTTGGDEGEVREGGRVRGEGTDDSHQLSRLAVRGTRGDGMLVFWSPGWRRRG